jgi:L-ascorbate metabolism protein UlaG (beta-lactamase superfamily)
MNKKSLAIITLALWAACAAPAVAAPPTVEMTWMSIANWYFKIGDKRILMDGYITRVPENLFVASSVFPRTCTPTPRARTVSTRRPSAR